ncbi:MAG: DUF2070 family protein [Candidatus Anstonellales archaeon]
MSIKSAKAVLYFSKLFFNPNNKFTALFIIFSTLTLIAFNQFLTFPIIYLAYLFGKNRANKALFIIASYSFIALLSLFIFNYLIRFEQANFFDFYTSMSEHNLNLLILLIGIFAIPSYFIIRVGMNENYLISLLLITISTVQLTSYNLLLELIFLGSLIAFELIIQFLNWISISKLKLNLLDTFSGLLDFWYDDDDSILQEVMSKIGIERRVSVSKIIVNYDSHNLNLIVPQIHFGPISSIGSGDFPKLLQEKENNENKFIVFHTAVTHDSDLVDREEVLKIIEQITKNQNYESKKVLKFRMIKTHVDNSTCHVVDFELFTLIFFSNYPKLTEDITESFGQKLYEKAKTCFSNPLIIDCHDSDTHELWYVDEKSIAGKNYLLALEKAINEIKDLKYEECNLKFVKLYSDDVEELGSNGIAAIEFSTKNQKVLLLIYDSNSIEIELRKKLEIMLSKYYENFIICSTDTHEINVRRGITNPLADAQRVLDLTNEVINRLLKIKSTKASTSFAISQFNVKVLGNSLQYSQFFAIAISTIALIILLCVSYFAVKSIFKII